MSTEAWLFPTASMVGSGEKLGTDPRITQESIATAVTNGCGPVVSPSTERRLGSPPHERPPRTSHHRADAGPCIIEC
jgi:hypothetical protein